MLDINEKKSNELNIQAEKILKEACAIIKPSRFHSWTWATNTFAEALEWLMAHPAQLHRGEYMGSTFAQESWHLRLPDAFGGTHILFKRTDGYKLPFFERFSVSSSLNEALNFSMFNAIRINVPDVLACGESRELGMLRSSFIITRYIQNTCDGSTLMPGGPLHENEVLRMGFCRTLMEYIARLHLAGFSHIQFHPSKLIFPQKCYEKNPSLTWVNAETCIFNAQNDIMKNIPNDLVRVFVDLRLTTKEIKELCECYLDSNTFCGFTPQSLWQKIISIQ